MLRAVLVMAGIAILVTSVLVTGSTFAAKGGNGNGPRAAATDPGMVLVESNPYFGGTASFTVSYPAMKSTPMVRVLCFQGDQMVYQYSQWSNGSDTWTPQFTLWSDPWAANGGGLANCGADLFYFTYQGQTQTGVVYLAHTEFTASGG
jgi:hypothetical protein